MLSVLRVERLLRRRLPLRLGGEVAHDAQQPPELRATLAGEVAGAQGAREEAEKLDIHVEKVRAMQQLRELRERAKKYIYSGLTC